MSHLLQLCEECFQISCKSREVDIHVTCTDGCQRTRHDFVVGELRAWHTQPDRDANEDLIRSYAHGSQGTSNTLILGELYFVGSQAHSLKQVG